jgi:hypothetical protein
MDGILFLYDLKNVGASNIVVTSVIVTQTDTVVTEDLIGQLDPATLFSDEAAQVSNSEDQSFCTAGEYTTSVIVVATYEGKTCEVEGTYTFEIAA